MLIAVPSARRCANAMLVAVRPSSQSIILGHFLESKSLMKLSSSFFFLDKKEAKSQERNDIQPVSFSSYVEQLCYCKLNIYAGSVVINGNIPRRLTKSKKDLV